MNVANITKVTKVKGRRGAHHLSPWWIPSEDSRVLAIAILLILVACFVAVAVFTELEVYMTVLAVGIAVALQKYLASYFGFFVIEWSKIINLGDRIRIGSIKGDVKRIGIFHFVLEEVGEDEKLGGELTGRILHIPNLIVLDQPVLNYSKSYSVGNKLLPCDYIFDEIRIPVGIKSDIEGAANLLESILKAADQRIIEEAKEAFRSDYPDFLREAEQGPRMLIYLEPGRVWLQGKFVAPVRTRNQLKSQVLWEFMRQARGRDDIQLA